MLPDLDSIRPRRKALGLTQKQFAYDLKEYMDESISQSMLAKVERGQAVPNYNAAKAIFEFLEKQEQEAGRRADDVMNEDVIVLSDDDRAEDAFALAKENAISQFPVRSEDDIVGSIRTQTMIDLKPRDRIGEAAEPPFPQVNPGTPVSAIKDLLHHEQAVLVVDDGDVGGIVTPQDLL